MDIKELKSYKIMFRDIRLKVVSKISVPVCQRLSNKGYDELYSILVGQLESHIRMEINEKIK